MIYPSFRPAKIYLLSLFNSKTITSLQKIFSKDRNKMPLNNDQHFNDFSVPIYNSRFIELMHIQLIGKSSVTF